MPRPKCWIALGMDGADVVAQRRRWDPAAGNRRPGLPGGDRCGASAAARIVSTAARGSPMGARRYCGSSCARAAMRCPAWPTHRCAGRRELHHDDRVRCQTGCVSGSGRLGGPALVRALAPWRRRLSGLVGPRAGRVAAAARAPGAGLGPRPPAAADRWRRGRSCACSRAARSATSATCPGDAGIRGSDAPMVDTPVRIRLAPVLGPRLCRPSALAAAARADQRCAGACCCRPPPPIACATWSVSRSTGRRRSPPTRSPSTRACLGAATATVSSMSNWWPCRAAALDPRAGRAGPAGADAGRHRRGRPRDGAPLGVNLLPLGAASAPAAIRWRLWNLALSPSPLLALAATLWQLLDNRRAAADALEQRIARDAPGPARRAAAQRQRLSDLVEGQAFLDRTRAGAPDRGGSDRRTQPPPAR